LAENVVDYNDDKVIEAIEALDTTPENAETLKRYFSALNRAQVTPEFEE